MSLICKACGRRDTRCPEAKVGRPDCLLWARLRPRNPVELGHGPLPEDVRTPGSIMVPGVATLHYKFVPLEDSFVLELTEAADFRLPIQLMPRREPIGLLTLPAGYKWNGADFPPAAYVVGGILRISKDRLLPASAIHDYLVWVAKLGQEVGWDGRRYTRHQADLAFYEVALATPGVTLREARYAYAAVRLASILDESVDEATRRELLRVGSWILEKAAKRVAARFPAYALKLLTNTLP